MISARNMGRLEDTVWTLTVEVVRINARNIEKLLGHVEILTVTGGKISVCMGKKNVVVQTQCAKGVKTYVEHMGYLNVSVRTRTVEVVRISVSISYRKEDVGMKLVVEANLIYVHHVN